MLPVESNNGNIEYISKQPSNIKIRIPNNTAETSIKDP